MVKFRCESIDKAGCLWYNAGDGTHTDRQIESCGGNRSWLFQIIEYTKEGSPTTFTITATEIYKRWEFDVENSNMRGHWVGTFCEIDGHTEIDFTEDVTAKKWFMKPFVKLFLKKQQSQYITDLKKALQE